MKNIWQLINKIYLATSLMIAAVIFSVVLLFTVQFKVESLQGEVAKTEKEIAVYKDKIQLLEVEWVYLTRPERLRDLSSKYLKNNGYALASQIKDVSKLKKYYLTSYEKSESKLLSFRDVNDDGKASF